MRLEYFAAAGQTLVPNVFIDKYMTEANGEFVKVYLCLLRLHGTAEVDVGHLAERLDLSERTVNRALVYLEKCGLLKLFCDEKGIPNGIRMLSGINAQEELAPEPPAPAKAAEKTEAKAEAPAKAAGKAPAKAPARPQAEAPAPADSEEAAGKQPAKAPKDKPERRHYQPTEVSRLCEEDGEFNMLVSVVAPAYLERTLKHTDNEIFAYLYRDVKLPVDVLEYCIEQCVERKKDDRSKAQFMRYIETVALRWKEEGVRTLEDARAAAARFDEKTNGAQTERAGKKPVKRNPKIQAAYGYSTERSNVDYNALAWSRMWEEK